MRGFEQGLARILPRAHQLKLGGAVGLAVMTLPGLGLDYWSDGDLAPRLALHEALLADLPDHWLTRPARARLFAGLISLYARQGDQARALAATQQALALAEKMHNRGRIADGNVWLGRLNYALGHYPEAAAAFQRAVELSPRARGVHTWLGHTYNALHRTEAALAAYQQAIELFPQDAEPHLGVGHAYRYLERYADAAVAYQWAVELEPDSAFAYDCLGAAQHRLEHSAEAEAAYRRAIELDPAAPQPCDHLGDLCSRQSRYAEALGWYQQAVDKETDAHPRAVLRLSLGKAQQMLEQYEPAVATYRLALATDPALMSAQLELAACYRKLGREAEAAGPLQQARRLMAPDDAYHRACLESISGHTAEALAWLKTALDREPQRRAWARDDRDFDFIREAAAFQALIGPAAPQAGA
jgi:tetratricopeptide (TPR) repeat protein